MLFLGSLANGQLNGTGSKGSHKEDGSLRSQGLHGNNGYGEDSPAKKRYMCDHSCCFPASAQHINHHLEQLSQTKTTLSLNLYTPFVILFVFFIPFDLFGCTVTSKSETLIYKQRQTLWSYFPAVLLLSIKMLEVGVSCLNTDVQTFVKRGSPALKTKHFEMFLFWHCKELPVELIKY